MAAYEPKFKSGWVPPEIVGTGRSVPQEVGAAVASVASASASARASVKVRRMNVALSLPPWLLTVL